MYSQDRRLSTTTDSSNGGFTSLCIFLQNAFQQRGLVSIPPTVLQRFKQCPMQDIECPDIAAFAKLFEGTRSSNRFRLEANSFVYVVQILFHLRPNLVQERILHLLMVSVRLLKHEKEATQRLSDLAGKEIDRHAVARKRAIISSKLVPWLLKQFSLDSTIVRLKIIAAQFLFHLLQGDEEAKRILSSAPQKERWTLGGEITASPNPTLRILAANILREISLANIDMRLFWSPDLPDDNGHGLPSSFIADVQWLHNTALYMNDLDDRQAIPIESRAKIHEALSLTVGSLACLDDASIALASITDRLLFLLPAHQNKPLQILEIPLVAAMDDVKMVGTAVRGDTKEGKVELLLKLPNTGFYILNGLKNAVNQIHLSFATDDARHGFCEAMAHSLRNVTDGKLITSLQHHVDKVVGKPQTKKHSRAAMIDLSHDVVISPDSPLTVRPSNVPCKVSTSGLIDLSASTESSVSQSPPFQERTEQENASNLPEENEERDAAQLESEVRDYKKTESKTILENQETDEIIRMVAELPDSNELQKQWVAPAQPEFTSQETVVAETIKSHLPQHIHERGVAETNVSSSDAIPILQHLAMDALQHSAMNPTTVVSNLTDTVIRSEKCSDRSRAPQPEGDAPPPVLLSPALANSARKKGLKPITAKQVGSLTMSNARKQVEKTNGDTSRCSLGRSREAKAVPSIETAVDWDEDLRTDHNEHKGQRNVGKLPKAGTSRRVTTRPKKPIERKAGPKSSRPKTKAPPKAQNKENKTQAAINACLTTTLSQPAAAKVSYDEQQGQAQQAQDTSLNTKDTISQVGTKHASTAALSPNTNGVQMHCNMQSIGDQDLGDSVVASPFAERLAPFFHLGAAVQTSGSSEAPAARVEPRRKPKEDCVVVDGPGAKTASVRGQRDKTTEVSGDPSRQIDLSDGEAVNDSHQMERRQRADAINAGRRSFGETLMNVMNESGVQAVKTDHVVARTQPFGDKSAFIESIKTALDQSLDTHGTQIPSSSRKKQAQTPSIGNMKSDPTTGQGRANGILHSTLKDSQLSGEGSISRPKSDEVLAMTNVPRPANVAADQTKPPIENEVLHKIGPHGSSSSSRHSIKNLKRSTEIVSRGTCLTQSGEVARAPEKEVKRGPTSDGEKPVQAKRAKMIEAGSGRYQIGGQSRAKAVLQSSSNANARVHDPKDESSISSPWAQVLKKDVPCDQTSAHLRFHQIQNPAQRVSWDKGPSEIKSWERAVAFSHYNTQTPRSYVGLGVPTLTADHLQKNVQPEGSSSKGRRHQGLAPVEKRGIAIAQSISAPTETYKHLAFKKLHVAPKSVEQLRESAPIKLPLFGRNTKRTVQLPFSDTDDGTHADKGVAENAAPAHAASNGRNGKIFTHPSKVDENGSPRLHLRETSGVPPTGKGFSTFNNTQDSDESVGSTSAFESSEGEGLYTQESPNFGLEAAVKTYTTANMQKNAMLATTQSRQSIGIGRLLDRSFPQASRGIETRLFKGPILVDSAPFVRASPKPGSTNKLNHDRSQKATIISRGVTESIIPVIDGDGNHSFDIDRLNISVADEQSSPGAPARIRRLRSSSPCSLGDGVPRTDESPLSFDTRLGKMIMPPPLRKELEKVKTPNECGTGPYFLGGQLVTMDAEATLVNGENFEEDTNVASSQRQLESSSSISDEFDFAQASRSKEAGDKASQGDRKFWNQDVRETQQTLLESLERVSQKLLMRFSSAENGIQFKLDQYHYGGRKILNNFVEQFDKQVMQEKEMPSPRVRQHRKHLLDTTHRLQQANDRLRAGPPIEDLEKSRKRRSHYVLANLEKLAAAQ